jgi:Leucine-rich repeat (LRR) protein
MSNSPARSILKDQRHESSPKSSSSASLQFSFPEMNDRQEISPVKGLKNHEIKAKEQTSTSSLMNNQTINPLPKPLKISPGITSSTRSSTESDVNISSLRRFASPKSSSTTMRSSRSSTHFEDLIRSERKHELLSDVKPIFTSSNEKLAFRKIHEQIMKQEILCLAALYHATSGNTWRTSKNWTVRLDMMESSSSSALSLKDWHGIEVNATGHINELRLLMNDLQGIIPSDFCKLEQLCYLDLSNNHLHGSIPEEICQLSSLRELKLHYNQLSGSIPNSIGLMSSLRGLHLEGNHFTGSIPSSLGNIKYLEKINIAGSQLSGTIPVELGQLRNLKELKLNQNRLTGSIPTSFCDLVELRLLYLQNNKLTGEIPAGLANLPNLLKINCSYNQLTGILPEEFIKKSLAMEIKLDYTHIVGPRRQAVHFILTGPQLIYDL